MSRTDSRWDNLSDDQLEARLRAGLADSARSAPQGDYLAEQIIAAATRTAEHGPVITAPPRSPRSWKTWTTPLIAAAAVAAVVTSLVAVNSGGSTNHTATRVGAGPSANPTRVAPIPFGSTKVTPTTHAKPSSSSGIDPSSFKAVGVHAFRAVDISFSSPTDGWALGTSQCLQSAGRCTALLRTTDGQNWHDFPLDTVFTVGTNAVQHFRFATDQIGYAYGANQLWMTTDGGKNWTQQPGSGALALGSADGVVIRVVDKGSGCPGPCDVSVETSTAGSSTWTKVPLSSTRIDASSVQLSVAGATANVLVQQNTAGGAPDQQSTLYVSSDNGAHWSSRGEPCQQHVDATEDDSVALSAGGGIVAVVCEPRIKTDQLYVETSPAGGKTFRTRGGSLTAGTVQNDVSLTSIAAATPTVLLYSGGNGLERSTNGGVSWKAVPGITGQMRFIGFETATVGRAVSADGRTIYTTVNGGRHWTSFTFPS